MLGKGRRTLFCLSPSHSSALIKSLGVGVGRLGMWVGSLGKDIYEYGMSRVASEDRRLLNLALVPQSSRPRQDKAKAHPRVTHRLGQRPS